MNGEELFEIWAPRESAWSKWAKPILFAQPQLARELTPPDGGEANFDVSWAPAPSEGAAIVVDLAGPRSVLCGASLAGRGYVPVPLFNCASGLNEVLDVSAIMDQLARSAKELEKIARRDISDKWPPAFLIDSQRLKGTRQPAAGHYDNRWMVFPQDFPSAALLRSKGIGKVIVARGTPGLPDLDLLHTLYLWQEGGVEILLDSLPEQVCAQPVKIPRPSSFRWVAYRFFAALRFRRNAAGGFGGKVPVPTESGGGSGWHGYG